MRTKMSKLKVTVKLILTFWFLQIRFAIGTSNNSDPSNQNIINPPHGTFCFISFSELVFEWKMQQIASSAQSVGAGRLADMNMIQSGSSQQISGGSGQIEFMAVYGAGYFIDQNEYSSVIQYCQSKYPTSYVSEVIVVFQGNIQCKCTTVELGLQQDTYPYLDNSGNGPSPSAFQKQMGRLGAPPEYLQQLQNMQPSQYSNSPPGSYPRDLGQTQLYPNSMQSTPPGPLSSDQQYPLANTNSPGRVNPDGTPVTPMQYSTAPGQNQPLQSRVGPALYFSPLGEQIEIPAPSPGMVNPDGSPVSPTSQQGYSPFGSPTGGKTSTTPYLQDHPPYSQNNEYPPMTPMLPGKHNFNQVPMSGPSRTGITPQGPSVEDLPYLSNSKDTPMTPVSLQNQLLNTPLVGPPQNNSGYPFNGTPSGPTSKSPYVEDLPSLQDLNGTPITPSGNQQSNKPPSTASSPYTPSYPLNGSNWNDLPMNKSPVESEQPTLYGQNFSPMTPTTGNQPMLPSNYGNTQPHIPGFGYVPPNTSDQYGTPRTIPRYPMSIPNSSCAHTSPTSGSGGNPYLSDLPQSTSPASGNAPISPSSSLYPPTGNRMQPPTLPYNYNPPPYMNGGPQGGSPNNQPTQSQLPRNSNYTPPELPRNQVGLNNQLPCGPNGLYLTYSPIPGFSPISNKGNSKSIPSLPPVSRTERTPTYITPTQQHVNDVSPLPGESPPQPQNPARELPPQIYQPESENQYQNSDYIPGFSIASHSPQFGNLIGQGRSSTFVPPDAYRPNSASSPTPSTFSDNQPQEELMTPLPYDYNGTNSLTPMAPRSNPNYQTPEESIPQKPVMPSPSSPGNSPSSSYSYGNAKSPTPMTSGGNYNYKSTLEESVPQKPAVPSPSDTGNPTTSPYGYGSASSTSSAYFSGNGNNKGYDQQPIPPLSNNGNPGGSPPCDNGNPVKSPTTSNNENGEDGTVTVFASQQSSQTVEESAYVHTEDGGNEMTAARSNQASANQSGTLMYQASVNSDNQ